MFVISIIRRFYNCSFESFWCGNSFGSKMMCKIYLNRSDAEHELEINKIFFSHYKWSVPKIREFYSNEIFSTQVVAGTVV